MFWLLDDWLSEISAILSNKCWSRNLFGAAFALLWVISCESAAVSQDDTRALAVKFLRSIPKDTKIYMWKTKFRPYEVITDEDNSVPTDIIRKYNMEMGDYYVFNNIGVFAQVSIYVYNSRKDFGFSEFSQRSTLTPSYKKFLNGKNLFGRACEFSNIVGEDRWAVGGFVFMDVARLTAVSAQQDCLMAGLDVVSGFPASPQTNYLEYPSHAVRKIVLEALATCSFGESVGTLLDSERTKDGFSPLPSIDCAIGVIQNDLNYGDSALN